MSAEIITLRAIALKPGGSGAPGNAPTIGRDHNATSYSTETNKLLKNDQRGQAEIITLRAIALKQGTADDDKVFGYRRDHNATSYSTETGLKR